MNEPVYFSIFRKEFQDLICIKKSLSFTYDAEAAAFSRIDRFFLDNHVSEKYISKELCGLWCKKRSYESVANQAHRISSLRIFCIYLNDIGIAAAIGIH